MKALAGKFSGGSTRMVSSSGISFALFISLLVLTITYRVMLTIGLFTNPIRPFDFSPGSHPIKFALAFWYYDLGLALACFLLLLFSLGGDISSREEEYSSFSRS